MSTDLSPEAFRRSALQRLAAFAFHPPEDAALPEHRHRRNALAAVASVIVLHDPDPESADSNLYELSRFAEALPGRAGPCMVGRRVALYLREVRTDIHLAGTPAEIRERWSRGSVELAFADEVERLRAAYVEGYLADPLPTLAVVRARALAALHSQPATP